MKDHHKNILDTIKFKCLDLIDLIEQLEEIVTFAIEDEGDENST